ncbi:MAG: TonB-dependent receptor [Rhodothermales bacterium]|nr:TonB-dependent receptor [Rhodothermales bacterium]
MLKPTLVALLLILISVPSAYAQETAPDSLRSYDLDAVVITASRVPSTIRSSTSAVSRIDSETIEALPAARISDVLELIPGLAFLSLDGLGFDPQITVRGFYGGGEAEYVTMLVDGKPINNIERGLINWDLLSGLTIESIEAVKGSASSLYGDVTVGGIINVKTAPTDRNSTTVSLSGGSYQTFRGSLTHAALLGSYPVSFTTGGTTTDGYRDNADRTSFNIGGTARIVKTKSSEVRLQTIHYWKDTANPGPVASSVRVADSLNRFSSPLYRFDAVRERLHRTSLTFDHALSSSSNVSAEVAGLFQSADDVRTLELFPGFGDTQNRDAQSRRLFSSVLFSAENDVSGIPITVAAGVDASYGRLSNSYFTFFSGGIDDYASAGNITSGEKASESEIDRVNIAAYSQVSAAVTSRLDISAGIRFDMVKDSFEPVLAAVLEDKVETTHEEFSPRVGMNVQLVKSRNHIGNMYANVSRTFKTPTLDQLYDQRLIPFGEFSIALSNGLLVPQSGTGFDVGYYHSYSSRTGLQVEGSVSVYTIDMTNELDFSLETFSYTNLGKSRHQGVEFGLASGYQTVRAFLNYTLQDVTLEFGDNDGNAVKAIPRNLIVGGISWKGQRGVGGSARVRNVSGVFLDDANTIVLPDFATLDLKAEYSKGPATASLTVANVLDQNYSTTGFLLSVEGFGSQLNMYPAAGRFMMLGLNVKL